MCANTIPASKHNNLDKRSSVSEANYKRFRCSHCAVEFEAIKEKRYCTRKCNQAAIRKNKTSVSRAEYVAKVREHSACKFTCEYCGKEAHRKLSGTNKKKGIVNRFCSMECRKKSAAAIRPAPFSPCCASYCKKCGGPFVSRRKSLYCSDACQAEANRISVAPESKECRCCGSEYRPEFTGGRPSEYCGDTCRNLVAAAIRRVSGAKRDAVLRAATVENVDPFKVFDRDRWRCQLCGVKTPKSKRGTYGDDAPELDHIIPLAKGGEHSYRNTQCACRKCNGLKSDSIMGQLLLIG